MFYKACKKGDLDSVKSFISANPEDIDVPSKDGWTGLIIFFIDKFNRITFLSFCMILSSISFLCMGLIDDPTSAKALPFIILLGVGKISVFF